MRAVALARHSPTQRKKLPALSSVHEQLLRAHTPAASTPLVGAVRGSSGEVTAAPMAAASPVPKESAADTDGAAVKGGVFEPKSWPAQDGGEGERGGEEEGEGEGEGAGEGEGEGPFFEELTVLAAPEGPDQPCRICAGRDSNERRSACSRAQPGWRRGNGRWWDSGPVLVTRAEGDGVVSAACRRHNALAREARDGHWLALPHTPLGPQHVLT